MSEAASAVVAVGASAGGVGALTTFVKGLPPDLRAGVVVVLHVPPEPESVLPKILARAGPLPVAHARDGEPIVPGHVYVAPPDCHVLVWPGRLQVVRGPRENLMRPAVDPLFRSAAASYGPNAIAVVLSGSLDDGASGARAVAAWGGTVIVQEPRDARFPGMPEATIAVDHPDHVVPAAKIAPLVTAILREPPATDGRVDNDRGMEMSLEARYAALEPGAIGREHAPGELMPFSCPECGGSLWETDDADLPRFRCRVGHAYTAETAIDDQERALDQALWVALRTLLERASLARRLSERTAGTASVARFEQLERDARANAEVIRNVLLRRNDGRDD